MTLFRSCFADEATPPVREQKKKKKNSCLRERRVSSFAQDEFLIARVWGKGEREIFFFLLSRARR